MNLLRVGALNGSSVVVRAVVGLVVTKLSAAVLGPAGFVALANVQTVITVWMGLANGTFSNSVTKLLAEPGGDGEAGRVLATSCVVAVAAGVFLAPVVWFASTAVTAGSVFGAMPLLSVVLAACCPFVTVGAVLAGYLNGLHRLGELVAGNILASCLNLVGAVFLIRLFGATGALYAAIFASLTLFLSYSSIRAVKRGLAREAAAILRTGVDAATAKKIMPYALTALASAIAAPVTLYLVRHLLATEVGLAEAGKWQAVWRLSELYLAPVTATFSVYLLPRFAGIVCSADMRAEFKRCVLLVGAAMVMIVLSVTFLGQLLVQHLLGSAFLGAERLFPLQLVGDALKLLGWMSGFLLLSKGAIRSFIIAEALAATSFIGITWLLVGLVGIEAAVFAYLGSYVFYLMFCLYASRQAGYL